MNAKDIEGETRLTDSAIHTSATKINTQQNSLSVVLLNLIRDMCK